METKIATGGLTTITWHLYRQSDIFYRKAIVIFWSEVPWLCYNVSILAVYNSWGLHV